MSFYGLFIDWPLVLLVDLPSSWTCPIQSSRKRIGGHVVSLSDGQKGIEELNRPLPVILWIITSNTR